MVLDVEPLSLLGTGYLANIPWYWMFSHCPPLGTGCLANIPWYWTLSHCPPLVLDVEPLSPLDTGCLANISWYWMLSRCSFVLDVEPIFLGTRCLVSPTSCIVSL